MFSTFVGCCHAFDFLCQCTCLDFPWLCHIPAWKPCRLVEVQLQPTSYVVMCNIDHEHIPDRGATLTFAPSSAVQSVRRVTALRCLVCAVTCVTTAQSYYHTRKLCQGVALPLPLDFDADCYTMSAALALSKGYPRF